MCTVYWNFTSWNMIVSFSNTTFIDVDSWGSTYIAAVRNCQFLSFVLSRGNARAFATIHATVPWDTANTCLALTTEFLQVSSWGCSRYPVQLSAHAFTPLSAVSDSELAVRQQQLRQVRKHAGIPRTRIVWKRATVLWLASSFTLHNWQSSLY